MRKLLMTLGLLLTLCNVATAVALACVCTPSGGTGTQCVGEVCDPQPDGSCICSGGDGCSCFPPGGASCTGSYCKGKAGGGCTCQNEPFIH